MCDGLADCPMTENGGGGEEEEMCEQGDVGVLVGDIDGVGDVVLFFVVSLVVFWLVMLALFIGGDFGW